MTNTLQTVFQFSIPEIPCAWKPSSGAKDRLPATVVQRYDSPRSYVVGYQRRKYRRNRRHLRLSTFQANIVPSRPQCSGPSTPPVHKQPSLELVTTHSNTPDKTTTPDQTARPQYDEPRPHTPQRRVAPQHQGPESLVKYSSSRAVKPPHRLNL